MRTFLISAMVLLFTWSSALAVQPDEVLDDPLLEARARELSAQMRCLVCQNQSIDESDAPLARDLRLLIRERLVKGETNDQVVTYLVSRYGEFVLLKPRFTANTVLLWLGPFAILLFGATILFMRRRKAGELAVPETSLSTDEQKKLKEILNKQE